ncbi:hypothetical protein F2Q70_00013487 [Brassica cretica]|uniref:F-box protein At3g26010-like beta-propeller domain-containing protein n=1 Tax=Brassica cretica TaxID=69181 RepID=A0A8S9M0L8_BRACR|nr:hypothetical protein F2Q70_00013487 [Brassica cretica]
MQRYHPHHSDASRCFEHCLCPCYKMICSTSQGFFVFIKAGRMTGKEEGYNVTVWRLIESDHSWEWDKAWEINMASIGIGFESVPMAINNFDVDIIYLWSLQHRRYVACIQTQTKYLGPSNRANEKYLPCNISVCFYPRNTLTQFVLSLQEMERKIHVKVPHWVGMNIVEAAHRNGIGACEGSPACSTCHVIVEPTDEENDMLDLAFGLTEILKFLLLFRIDISGFQIKEHALLFQLIHTFHHQHILRALELRLVLQMEHCFA